MNMCLFGSVWTFSFLKYKAIKFRFNCLVARQLELPWQPFCASLVGVLLMLAPKYEVDVTTLNGVMAHFTCTPYMPV